MADYKVTLLRGSDYKTTEWSGGTTTELSIAPEGSVYRDRQFEWRISSATVELEESDFTSLPDYNRIIMTLKGGIRLSHNKGRWIELPEFTSHSFDGGDETASVGRVTDFNLMTRKGVCTGDAVPFLLRSGESRRADTCLSGGIEDFKTVFLYCYDGELNIELESGEHFTLINGDSLRLDGAFKNASWNCLAASEASAVIAAVSYC